MSYLRKFICLALLHLVVTRPQINLDLTDQVSNKGNNIAVQHDCLHVAATILRKSDPQQIISYCLSESASKWNIKENSFDQKYTFVELAKHGITSEQLYLWSAPMDLIQRYQYYLDQLSRNSKKIISMDTQVFYNCTSSTFGPLCQYSLDGYESYSSSLTNIMYDFYISSGKSSSWTCYMHLQCIRSSNSICLTWEEICDGQIDCLNDAVDEKHCWQLQINECAPDEYRCLDGQCVPKTFLSDDRQAVDCINEYDAKRIDTNLVVNNPTNEPSMIIEDKRCLKNAHNLPTFVNSCTMSRSSQMVQGMFPNTSNLISDDCWFAFRCYFEIPDKLHPKCRDICKDRTCQDIINETCLGIMFIPNVPVFFGHIYIAYTKEAAVESLTRTLPPSYICYNDQLCSVFLPNKTLLRFNNLTCRKPEDFPLRFFPGGRGTWISTYIEPIYQALRKCNTILYDTAIVCNNSIMYQCVNSSKCISKDRVDDGIQDCDYRDDEQQTVINTMCLNDEYELFFNCPTTSKCINRRKVDDGFCHCGRNHYGLCEDEDTHLRYVTTHISFPTICDGFTELIPVTINGQTETDETECELWKCNNTYTRCDGFWNCPDGADEIDCGPSPFLNCSSEHICVAPKIYQFVCLSITKVNDGIIDCMGAIDEPNLCRSKNFEHNVNNFYCQNDPFQSCINPIRFCDGMDDCLHGDDEASCNRTGNLVPLDSDYGEFYKIKRSDIETFLITRQSDQGKLLRVHFSLDGITNPGIHVNETIRNPHTTNNIIRRCHRGFPLRVWIDKDKNLTDITCLCPPSYYGETCQYQNQRVSLTAKFPAQPDSRQTPFAIIISLIDNTNERIIHSFQQITYLYIRDCSTKFSVYLLYSTRPKDETKQYSIHIDFYEKLTLTYRGSLLIPVKFLFLPIQRIAVQLNIPTVQKRHEKCPKQSCIHGRCIRYSNHPQNTTFCQCNQGWSGQICNIPHTCSCSSDSLCIGVSADNRSICVCPIKKYGSRCLLHNTICQSTPNGSCYNHGECIPIDERATSDRKFFCVCPKGFTGGRCEIPSNKIILSFHKDIILPKILVANFIQVMNNNIPDNGSTFTSVSIKKKSAIIHWSHPFHIAFIELLKSYYLIVVQKTSNISITMTRIITPSDRCAYINEVLDENITQLHLLRRIKYYHVPCQNRSTNLSCFYDDAHFCLCTDFGHQRVANCFEFNYTKEHNCLGQSTCENGARCLQDRPTCPKRSACMCPACYYGAKCEFTSNGFGFSLDGILGYHIRPHSKVTRQPVIVQISVGITIIMAIGGLINGVLSVITFKNANILKVGCGVYLFISSITTLYITTIFALKFGILIVLQMNYITNRSFLKMQCTLIDFLLQAGLNTDRWLNACVAAERAVTAFRGARFDQLMSKKIAKYVIILLLFLTIGTTMYDPFHRHLVENNEIDEEKRIWCIVTYHSSTFRILNSFMNIFHFAGPFIINIISTATIIFKTAQQRKRIQKHETYQHHLREQIDQHKNLLIAPFVLIGLAIPRLIISLSGCMESTEDSSLFLAAYFISFIPPMLTMVIFVLPSKVYKKEFAASIRRIRVKIRSYLHTQSSR